MNDVTQKFYNDPENAPDLSREDFYARKAVIDEVADWTEMMERSEVVHKNEWTPILYRYEVMSYSLCHCIVYMCVLMMDHMYRS